MRLHAIRLLTLAVCATAAVVEPVAAAAAAGGEASNQHIKKHHQRMSAGSAESLATREARTAPRSYGFAGSVCPGNARSFDCKIWPPPFENDADRKLGDGGE